MGIVYKILSEILETDIGIIVEYDIHDQLSDLGLDSLNFIKLVIELEEHFNVEIKDSDLLISNFATIDNIAQILNKYSSTNNELKKGDIANYNDIM